MIHVLLTEQKHTNGYYLKNILDEKQYFKIVGITENSIEILYTLIQNPVDVLIIDNSLNSINNTDCAGMVSKLNIDVKIILLLKDESEISTSWNPGLFAGYIFKTQSQQEVIQAITQIMYKKSKSFVVQNEHYTRQA